MVEISLESASAWGVAPGYHDISGAWVEATPATIAAVLAAMGADGSAPTGAGPIIARAGETADVGGPAEVVTEDGSVLRLDGSLPADLPSGYHTLYRLDEDRAVRLIVSPGRCHLSPEQRAWGWAAQLYAVRSERSWGLGDLADLRELGRWSSRLGAGSLLVNPLDAPLPVTPQEPSPYYPSSRRFRNPLYIRVEEVPGAERLGERLAPLARAGRALNRRRLIDRDRAHVLKTAALSELFSAFGGSESFEHYRAREGQGLRDYATFCALVEVYGSRWREWPGPFRHPHSPAVARFRRQHGHRARFHEWLQWLLDRQLASAAETIPLVHDLPIGSQADGADAWAWQDVFAADVSVGAPPDPFNASGQDWAVPPFNPWKLRAANYEPFVQTVRAALRHCAGLRVDHVMGLFRLFWIPAGAGPADGVYVRYPYQDLLDLLALESQRAGAFVVGEDLGTVEDVVREEMAARNLLSYRLLWFEDLPPAEYPPESLAALSTHDLPTLAGVYEGSDPDQGVRERLLRHSGAVDGDPTAEVAAAAYRALAASPSRLVAASLEDALGVAERPNKPGTTDEWPNWSLALPVTLEQLRDHRGPARLSTALRR